MTNAQQCTWNAVKEILELSEPIEVSEVQAIYDSPNTSVFFELYGRRDHKPKKFLIEPGGCLAKVYSG